MKLSNLFSYSPVGLLSQALMMATGVPGAEGGPLDSLMKSIFGNGATGRDKELMALEDEYLDDNREQDYAMRKRAWDEMDSPLAQMKSNVEAYEYAGLNKMGLAGAGAVAGASNQTSSGNVSAPGASQPMALELLSQLIGAKFREKELGIAQQHVDNETKKTDAEVEGINIQNAALPELLDLQKGDLKTKIAFMNQQIETEPVKRALLKSEISYKQAQTAVEKNIAKLQKIDLKYHDAYQAALTSSAQAYAQLQWTQNKFQQTLLLQQLALNVKQIEIMDQTIVNGKLTNGILAKDFHYYDSDRKFNRWNTGLGTAFKGVAAVAGLASGGAVIGKAMGAFSSPNPYAENYGTSYSR